MQKKLHLQVKKNPYEKHILFANNNSKTIRFLCPIGATLQHWKDNCCSQEDLTHHMVFLYCTTIVSTTLNPNSPGHFEVRKTLFIILCDSWFSHNIIYTAQAHWGRCGWTYRSTKRPLQTQARNKLKIIENFSILKRHMETMETCCCKWLIDYKVIPLMSKQRSDILFNNRKKN